MKKTLAVLCLVVASVPALAQHRHHGYHGHHRHYGGGGGWVAPLILGGVVGYAITRNPDPVVVQPPVVIQQPPVVTNPPLAANPTCGPWTETQQPDGSIVRQRTCTQ